MPSNPLTARPFIPVLTALLAVTLAHAATYTSSFIYAIRMSGDGRSGNYAMFFAYAAGMGLGAVLLPKALARLRCGGGRRPWLLVGILAAALAVRLPGLDAWEYGVVRDSVIVAGNGLITAGVFILFFTVVPLGRRGLWYGCGASAGFLWWRVMETLTQGAPEAAAWYQFFYTAQTVIAFLMAGLLVPGFAILPPPAANVPPAPEPPETKPPERRRILGLSGTLLLFYLANGFIGARLSPALSNAGGGSWPGHILIMLACPLFGLFLDVRGDGAKKLMLASSVFLMLAPTVNVLSGSPFLYSAIVSLGTLAQFAMLMTAILVFAGMGNGPGWFGAAVLFQFSFRLVSYFVNFLWQKMPETGDGVAVFLATAAAIGFHFAVRKMPGENEAVPPVPVAAEPDDDPIIEATDVPDVFQKYALTSRESEVLALFAGGKSTEEIAQQLFISKFTVRKHFQGIMTKMDVSNRNALLIKVLQEK
jgi:DNA-binding CsgD family transcriptional regulator/MFS family permease